MTDLMIDPLAGPDLDDVNEQVSAVRSRSADELMQFSQLYPVPVIRDLRDNLLQHIVKVLEDADLEDTASLIGNELFELDDYLKSVTVAPFTHERAGRMAQHYGADALQNTVAKVLRLMQEDGALEVC